MTTRAPHTSSDTEVRRALQRLGVDSDDHGERLSSLQGSVSTVQTSVTGLDSRVTVLEEASDASYQGEAAEAVAAGFPVYGLSNQTSVGVARADTPAKGRVLGLAIHAAAAGFAVTYTGGGRISMTDWTAVAGAAALTPSATYYLAPGGGITTIAPTAGGLVLVEIGQAIDSLVLNLNIKRPILL